MVPRASLVFRTYGGRGGRGEERGNEDKGGKRKGKGGDEDKGTEGGREEGLESEGSGDWFNRGQRCGRD